MEVMGLLIVLLAGGGFVAAGGLVVLGLMIPGKKRQEALEAGRVERKEHEDNLRVIASDHARAIRERDS